MKDNQDTTIWNELWNSIRFFHESKKGKYSLDTYLDILEKYTDKLIKETEKQGFYYLGGECRVTNSHKNNTYDFAVEMFFKNSNGEKISKEAKRSLSKDKFVTETDEKIKNTITFEIQKPDLEEE